MNHSFHALSHTSCLPTTLPKKPRFMCDRLELSTANAHKRDSSSVTGLPLTFCGRVRPNRAVPVQIMYCSLRAHYYVQISEPTHDLRSRTHLCISLPLTYANSRNNQNTDASFLPSNNKHIKFTYESAKHPQTPLYPHQLLF